MAARKRKIRHDENTREKIRVSQIINRLQKHIVGEIEMSASQVSAATTLLRKCLPDLAATDLTVKNQLEQDIMALVMGLDERKTNVSKSDIQPDSDDTVH